MDNFSTYLMLFDSSENDSCEKAFYSTIWYDSINLLSSEQFQNSFRMTRKHFNELVELIEKFSDRMGLRKKVAILYTILPKDQPSGK